MLINLDFSGVHLKLRQASGKTQVYDIVRKQWVALTPEEHVRQHIVHYLTEYLNYPNAMLAVEKKLMVGAMAKRYDIVVYNRAFIPWMLVECKEPGVMITEQTLHQLLNYQRVVQCPYWLLSNGHQTLCADANNIDDIHWVNKLPAYDF